MIFGTLLAQPKSYPVGKVNILYLNPLSFEEFLQATKPALYEYHQSINQETQIESIFHERLMETYRLYLIIGGMPECVMNWIETEDAGVINKLQGELISLYENDFSKHNGKVNSGRILLVFRSIVTQLAKDNGKFIYGCIKEGARVLTENYVIQQLQGMFEVEPHYYAPTSQEEIDLILQDGMRIIPGEIKAGNTTRAKAFHHYITKNQCEKAIRYSGLNYQKNEVICNIPLYMVGKTNELV